MKSVGSLGLSGGSCGVLTCGGVTGAGGATADGCAAAATDSKATAEKAARKRLRYFTAERLSPARFGCHAELPAGLNHIPHGAGASRRFHILGSGLLKGRRAYAQCSAGLNGQWR